LGITPYLNNRELSMKEILRKCYVCDKQKQKSINVDTDKFIYHNNAYFHYDCFIKHKLKEKTNKLSREEIVVIADKMVFNTRTLKTVSESIDRDRLVYWLYENYNISVLPSLFFIKLKAINDGTFSKGVNVPISCYDLLQIFIKMKSYLDKVNNKNERNGKRIDLNQRVNYDLAIVINNYDNYLKWRQKQKTEVIEKQEIQEEVKLKNSIPINSIIATYKDKDNKNEEINIADILDEVF